MQSRDCGSARIRTRASAHTHTSACGTEETRAGSERKGQCEQGHAHISFRPCRSCWMPLPELLDAGFSSASERGGGGETRTHGRTDARAQARGAARPRAHLAHSDHAAGGRVRTVGEGLPRRRRRRPAVLARAFGCEEGARKGEDGKRGWGEGGRRRARARARRGREGERARERARSCG